eukprot:CAMPEP_0175986242 /NCGR_PEP_ID=MMETSP0108-20121206/50037_1 /TAXON_ID=195067 ORGANISM="Goniomonas pacifica, Strain CCMP1869" /NCGR_SAMPLE_ID=MMETSP0108 /ASSEMBLY_ACC=CAM_ASM_000204 /LENGTH=88 /DNA_ID=CAMNT_0017317371 /DNA_START=74 /DNA_END=340 /DNA_ORIENTATION=-
MDAYKFATGPHGSIAQVTRLHPKSDRPDTVSVPRGLPPHQGLAKKRSEEARAAADAAARDPEVQQSVGIHMTVAEAAKACGPWTYYDN